MPAVQVEISEREGGGQLKVMLLHLPPLPPRHGSLDGWQPTDHSLLFLEIQMRLTQGTHCHQLPTEKRNGKISSDKKRTHPQPFLGVLGVGIFCCH